MIKIIYVKVRSIGIPSTVRPVLPKYVMQLVGGEVPDDFGWAFDFSDDNNGYRLTSSMKAYIKYPYHGIIMQSIESV
jgi:hypothetical protein